MLSPVDPQDEAIIRQIAVEQGMIGEIHFFDLLGGYGTNAALLGHIWRVFDPETMRAFILCLADEVRVGDVESLGLDGETVFICRESALDGETARFLMEHAKLGTL